MVFFRKKYHCLQSTQHHLLILFSILGFFICYKVRVFCHSKKVKRRGNNNSYQKCHVGCYAFYDIIFEKYFVSLDIYPYRMHKNENL